MSYLLDLLKSFAEPERVQFRQLDVIGKEEMVRDEYAKHADDKKFDETKLPVKLGLTQSHTDKINSLLLDKILIRLYGDDYTKILPALLSRGLSSLVWHELKIIERRVLKEKNGKALTAFYKAAFDTLIKMFHPNYKSKLTHKYGMLYLDSLGKSKTLKDEAYVALFAHYGDMIAEFFAGNEDTYKKPAWVLLEKWHLRLSEANNADAEAYYFFVLGNYYKYFSDSAEKFLEAKGNCIRVLKNASEETNRQLYGRALCEMGFGNIEKNEYARAQAYYEEAFNLSDAMFAKTHYHAGNFLLACLCNKKPQKAQEVFNSFHKVHMSTHVNRSLHFDVLQTRFLLLLHLNDLHNAFEVLNEMRSFKRNEITRLGNVMMRLCETLYYYKLKDYTVAAAMARKNLKFFILPANSSAHLQYYHLFIDCIDKLIKQHHGTLRFPERLSQQIAALPKGVFQCYNLLL